MHGISITKLLIRADVFLSSTGLVWKLLENEWSWGQQQRAAMHIIINSLGLLKSSAGLHGESPRSARSENVNEKLGKSVSIPRMQTADRKTSIWVRSFGWVWLVLLMDHGSAFPLGSCKALFYCRTSGSISAGGYLHDLTPQMGCLTWSQEDACCERAEAG